MYYQSLQVFSLLLVFIVTTVLADLLVLPDGQTTKCHKLTAYVADWEVPKSIPWNKLDHINYAFAVPDRQGKLSQFNPNQLKSVVSDAHNNNKSVSLSVGGWTGSLYFSSLVSTEESRQKFADTLVQTCVDYNIDGVDIDWEYPNSANGISCNQNNSQDTPNLLKFVQLLRSKLDEKFPHNRKRLTAAVSALVFNNENKQPYESLDPAWSTAFDALQIMVYDLNKYHGNYTSANAPLFHTGPNNEPTVDIAVQQWNKTGIPFERIILGVPFFGYTTLVTESTDKDDNQYLLINHSHPQIQADQHDSYASEPCPGATKKSYSGEMQWRSIKQSVLSNNSWRKYYNSDTRTPFAYNDQQKQFLSFDNPQSLKAKVDYVKKYKLGGIMFWSLEMDDEEHTLLNALQDIYNDDV
ncbi:glycoside hydrolase superfamily [Circinella umbellata]|nr:glycoside hydrolase superfamily [Circinella umbellata]